MKENGERRWWSSAVNDPSLSSTKLVWPKFLQASCRDLGALSGGFGQTTGQAKCSWASSLNALAPGLESKEPTALSSLLVGSSPKKHIKSQGRGKAGCSLPTAQGQRDLKIAEPGDSQRGCVGLHPKTILAPEGFAWDFWRCS